MKVTCCKSKRYNISHMGFNPTSHYTLPEAIQYLSHLPNLEKNNPLHGKEMLERNAKMLQLYQEGYSLVELALEFGIMEQWVHQIIRYKVSD